MQVAKELRDTSYELKNGSRLQKKLRDAGTSYGAMKVAGCMIQVEKNNS